MLQQLAQVNKLLAALSDEMSQCVIAADDAVAVMDAVSRAARLVDSCMALAVGRVEQVKAHRGYGARNAAAFVALHAGMSVGKAKSIVDTAISLDEAPAVRAALVAGSLSLQQAAQIIPAVKADPAAEASLIDAARSNPFKELHDRCENVIAAASSYEDAYDRAHAARSLRFRTEGSVTSMLGEFATADVASLMLRVQADAAVLHATARKSGHRLRKDATMADALIGLLEPLKARPEVTVNLVCTQEAFDRGYTQPGETCEIPGVGPISVEVVRTAAQSAPIHRFGVDGKAIVRVKHERPTIPAQLRSALVRRYPVCSVIGCDVVVGLQIDHIIPVTDGGATTMPNLHRPCEAHHSMKTHLGYTFVKNKEGDVEIHAPPVRRN